MIIAIVLDAASREVIDLLLGRGELPALQSLAGEGSRCVVDSTIAIGNMAGWPSLITGLTPEQHGYHNDWMWDPDSMRMRRVEWERFTPFWEALARRGCRTVIIDVPFARVRRMDGVNRIHDWGSHEGPGGPLFADRALKELVRSHRHPYQGIRLDAGTLATNEAASRRAHRLAVDGIRVRSRVLGDAVAATRPHLAVANFDEMHVAGHHILHHTDPQHPGYMSSLRELVFDVYRAADTEIGALRRRFPDAGFVVFSLHGMRAARGIPLLHAPLMEAFGYASSASTGPTQADRRHRIPGPIRALYHDRVPRHIRYWIGKQPFPENFDWPATRAFPLFSHNHGWIRINLRGRERDGIVGENEYAALREEIRHRFLSVVTVDGEPVAADVIYPNGPELPRPHEPDLVVQWSDVVKTRGADLEVREPRIRGSVAGTDLNALHQPNGVLFSTLAVDAPFAVHDIPALLCRAAGAPEAIEETRKANERPEFPFFMQRNVIRRALFG